MDIAERQIMLVHKMGKDSSSKKAKTKDPKP